MSTCDKCAARAEKRARLRASLSKGLRDFSEHVFDPWFLVSNGIVFLFLVLFWWSMDNYPLIALMCACNLGWLHRGIDDAVRAARAPKPAPTSPGGVE